MVMYVFITNNLIIEKGDECGESAHGVDLVGCKEVSYHFLKKLGKTTKTFSLRSR